MTLQEHEPPKIFICYSHNDARWLERLRVHLKSLEQEGIKAWSDRMIAPGTKWREEIQKSICAARVAIILISADFFASDFISTNELPQLLLAAETDGVNILQVIISPSRFQQHPILSQFQAVNDPQKPLIKLKRGEQETVWVELIESVKSALSRTQDSIKEALREQTSHNKINNDSSSDNNPRAIAIIQPPDEVHCENNTGTKENQNKGTEAMNQPVTRLGRVLNSPRTGWVLFALTVLLALFLIFELATKSRDPLGMRRTNWAYTTEFEENSEGSYRKLRGTNFFIDFDGYSYTMNGYRTDSLAKEEKSDNNWRHYDPPIPIKISRVSFSLSPPTLYFYFEVDGKEKTDEGKGFVDLPIDQSDRSKMVGTVYYLHNTKDEKTKEEKKTWAKATITFVKQ